MWGKMAALQSLLASPTASFTNGANLLRRSLRVGAREYWMCESPASNQRRWAATTAATSSSGNRNSLLVTLSSAAETYFLNHPVQSLTLPGKEGSFTVTNNHQQCVVQLKAGVVTVRTNVSQGGTASTSSYFLSDGFLFLSYPQDNNGCCTARVSAVEVVPVEALSKDAAEHLLAELRSSPRETDWAKARFFLAQELLTSVIRAASSS